MTGSALKAGARRLIFDNFPKLLFISLLYVVFITVVSWLSFRLPGTINLQDIYDRLATGEIPNLWIIYTNFRPTGVFLAIILSLLLPVLDVGFFSYCMKINRSIDTEYRDLFNGFLYIIKVVSIFFITAVFIFLWSMLFIVPGIVASYRYRLAYYVLIDDPGKGVLQCISESKLLMHGNKVDLLIIDLSFVGWYVLDYAILLLTPLPFVFPVVSIWLSPYVGLTRAAFYESQISSIAV